jgi:murein DD-endopeptidase MepM/ murein hydrolase activator NlpD
MLALGVTPSAIHHIIDALGSAYDFRRSHPSHEWRLALHENQPRQLTLHVSPIEIYDLTELHRKPVLTRRHVEVVTSMKVIRGQIEGSLFQSLSEHPNSAQLALKLAQVFAWDIDFFQDPRTGDQFEILAEQRHIMTDDGPVFHDYGPIQAAQYHTRRESFAAYYFEPKPGETGYYDAEGKSLIRDFLRSPLKFQRITSSYQGRRFHPVLKTYRAHRGIDYGAPRNTPVMAVSSGKVAWAGRKGGAGIAVEIQHRNKMLTQYFHLNKIARGVRRGGNVKQGQVIGYVGKTGLASGYHLHFGMKIGGKYVNPLRQKFQPGTPIASERMAAFQERMENYQAFFTPGPVSGPPLVRAPDFINTNSREEATTAD